MDFFTIPFSRYTCVSWFYMYTATRPPGARRDPGPPSFTNPLSRRGPHVASVHSIWSECSTRCGAQSAVGRAKKASIRIVERYATRPTSVV